MKKRRLVLFISLMSFVLMIGGGTMVLAQESPLAFRNTAFDRAQEMRLVRAVTHGDQEAAWKYVEYLRRDPSEHPLIDLEYIDFLDQNRNVP